MSGCLFEFAPSRLDLLRGDFHTLPKLGVRKVRVRVEHVVAAQVGHEDVTTTNRIYRYVLQRRQRGEIGRRRQLAMRESAADIGRSELLLHMPDGI